jgi:hypothetical protein
MASDYFIFVFMASVGLYQIVTIPAMLKALWFFNQPWLQYIFGILMIFGAYGWFFTSKGRNVQSTVEGAQQLGLFLGAIVASYFATAVLSSIIQAGTNARDDSPQEHKQQDFGLEALKTKTLFESIAARLKKGKKEKV